jgi:uncharacterized metal-binding protein YceD (DUF177 family)
LRIDLSNRTPDPWDDSIALTKTDASALFDELHLDGTLRGEFQIFPQGGDSFLVNGVIQGTQLLTCVRTLELFPRPFQLELVMDVQKTSGISAQEVEDEDGDTFVVRIPAIQDDVDITECVRQLVIIQEPMNPVKDPSGDFIWKDKDVESEQPESDSRWDKLKALKAKFNNPNG